MRKSLMIIAIMTCAVIMALSGCGKKESSENTNDTEMTEAASATDTADNSNDDAEAATTDADGKADDTESAATESAATEAANEAEAENPEDISDDDERLAEFFSNSVLTGDSISKHFGNYITKHKDALPGTMKLLSEGSFSLHNAKGEPDEKSTFPLYKGKKMKLEDAISDMQVGNVFMFFGINDLGIDSPENCLKLYIEQMDKIKEKSPDVRFFIISTTYLHEDKAEVYKNLNNTNIKKFNELVKEYCDTAEGVAYLDLATLLQDENGNLKAEYCNDNYCHHTEAAFKIWIEVLMNQAKTEVAGK